MSAKGHLMQVRLAVDGRVLDDRYHGIGRITEALLAQLSDDRDFSVTVFLRPGQRSERFNIGQVTAPSNFQRATFDLPLTSPLQWWRWPAVLKRSHCDVALFPYHLGAAVSGQARRISIVHDCIMEADQRFTPNTRTRLLYRLLTQIVIKRSRILMPSYATATEIERFYHVRPADWQILPWGVDPAFSPRAEQLRSIGDVALPTQYFLHVGARRPHKSVETIVAALERLDDEQSLVLVGNVDQRFPDPVPKVISDLGLGHRVIQIPHVSEADLVRLYARAKAFLYPSLVEGFGLPLLEAMAAGVPVVASNIPVFREVAGSAALFADVNSPTSWVDAIRRLEDPILRDQLVADGLRRSAAASWSSTGVAFKAALRHS